MRIGFKHSCEILLGEEVKLNRCRRLLLDCTQQRRDENNVANRTETYDKELGQVRWYKGLGRRYGKVFLSSFF